jgi:LPPG:FO 2-phospho-L-lactate transferase
VNVVVFTGGVGGAKLVLGLSQLLPPADITAIVNTGDDFRHLGLYVSPDIDTLLYTLSQRVDPAQGWGRAGDGRQFMAALDELGGESWFTLGDGDLALHVLRSHRLAGGDSLSTVTRDFARAWDIGISILPMSDRPVRTELETDIGRLAFQRYFVEHRCRPTVRRIDFAGAGEAEPAPGVLDALAGADAILIAPSNPYLSIDPILAVPGMGAALRAAARPVVAVSPIVGGQAVKGPTAKLMAELGVAVSNQSIAAHYDGLIDALLIHDGDTCDAAGIAIARTDTMMHDLADRKRVAAAALALAGQVAGG